MISKKSGDPRTLLYEMNENFSTQDITIIFILGGPGSGKGTQCLKISEKYGFCHLSAGDLLRLEVKLGSDIGVKIQNTMNEGKLVPSSLMVDLLKMAMHKSGNKKFLIDGFPRDMENLAEFDKVMQIDPDLILYLDCSKEVMVSRLLQRNQGREDDNIDTIKNRLEVFFNNTHPVIEYYGSKGKLRKIDAKMSADKVFEEIMQVFTTHRYDLC